MESFRPLQCGWQQVNVSGECAAPMHKFIVTLTILAAAVPGMAQAAPLPPIYVLTEQDDPQTRLCGVTNERVADVARQELRRRSVEVVEQRPSGDEWDRSLTLYARAGAQAGRDTDGKPDGICAAFIQLQLQSTVAINGALTGAVHRGEFVYCSKSKVGLGSVGEEPPLDELIATMLTNCLADYERNKFPRPEPSGTAPN